MNLRDAVTDVCPAPPPCFLNKQSWREYLQSAASVQNQKREPKVILIQDGEPVFNTNFDFCADCTQKKSVEMMVKGKCSPNFLKAKE